MSEGKAYAQVFEEGRSFVAVGYGIGNFGISFMKSLRVVQDYKITAIGPLFAKYEYAVTDKIGLGLNIAYVSAKSTYTYQDITLSNGQPYQETFDWNSYSILGRFNFHFGGNDKLDPYVGVGMGYRGASWTFSDNDPTDSVGVATFSYSNPFPLGYEMTLGLRFFFSENIGAYAEVGLAKAVFQAGLTAKF